MGHLLNMALMMASTPSTRLRVEMLDQTGAGYVEIYINSVLVDTLIPPTLNITVGKDFALNNGDTFYVKVYGDEYYGYDYFENTTYITSGYLYQGGTPVISSTYTAVTNNLYSFACTNVYL